MTVTQVLAFPQAIVFYAWTVLLYLAVRGGSFLVVGVWLPGRKIPGINPLRWMTVIENVASFTVWQYTVFRGFSRESVFTKYKDTSAAEVKRVLQFPEVRRLFFHSCCVIAERTGSVLILSDPLREKGYLHYPPHFKRVVVTLED